MALPPSLGARLAARFAAAPLALTPLALVGLLAACDRPAPTPTRTMDAAPVPTEKEARPTAPMMEDAGAMEGMAPPAASLPEGAIAALRGDLGADATGARYFAATIDLDGDGRDEAVAHLVGPTLCGTGGCPTDVLAQDDAGTWRVISRLAVTRTPIYIGAGSTMGWRDLLVTVGGGGGEPGVARLRFDGQGYPGNPTTGAGLSPGAPQDARVLIEDYTDMKQGAPL